MQPSVEAQSNKLATSLAWQESPIPADAATAETLGLLDSLIEATTADASNAQLKDFLAESNWCVALHYWFGNELWNLGKDQRALLERLDRDIGFLDELLENQLNEILHHPRFQRLEASWLGLDYLASQGEDVENLKIRVLNVNWRELYRDFEQAIEFDQSRLFQKIYSEQFDMAGGEPFGLLIGDYQIRHHPAPGHMIDDIAVLRNISQVAAAAFAPFIAGVHPAMFGLSSFHELGLPIDLQYVFKQPDYINWQRLRETEDSRFLGLVLPHILMRVPYEDDGSRSDGFQFDENVEDLDNNRYLWGNAAYAFAAIAMQAFANCGWLADIRGIQRDEKGNRPLASGGLVSGLPIHSFATDREGIAQKYLTDVFISDYQEKELAELGFIPLCHCRDTQWLAFYSNPSIQSPRQNYSDVSANANARLSSMLQYVLCASRFAHYLKIIGREKIGSFSEAKELENFLQKWLQEYTTARDSGTYQDKARRPLREAKIQIVEHPGKPGSFLCSAYLRPHYQLEQLTVSIKLETEITPSES